MIETAAWNDYVEHGFLHLDQIVDNDALPRLRARVDDLATGRVVNPSVHVQLDTGGSYDELAPVTGQPDAGSEHYRKVQGLETDELFGPLLRHPLFVEVCNRIYGIHAPISAFRAMVMNKPAQQGTNLPWHQDGGDVWALDRDPLVTIWVALDNADESNGCVQFVRGSHRLGLLSRFGSTLSPQDVGRYCRSELVEPLVVPAGHGVLMHNWLIHRSGTNPTATPRRAFTACLMDGRTRSLLTGATFPPVSPGHGSPPFTYLDQLHHELTGLRSSAVASEEYALSLQQTNTILNESAAQAARYARSLEAEIAMLHDHLAARGR